MKTEIEKMSTKVQKITNGFLGIQEEGERFVLSHSKKECLAVSKALLKSDAHQVRSLATFILGFISAKSKQSLEYLRAQIAMDEDWQVQETLAKAFDQYCSDIGYREALPTIKEWLKDKNPNVRRAVTEGLRIWTSREYFKDNPAIAIKLLSKLKDDQSEYVRKSVGNALKDISKKHKNLVKGEVSRWNLENKIYLLLCL